MAIERLYRPLSAFSRQQARCFTSSPRPSQPDQVGQSRAAQQELRQSNKAEGLAEKAREQSSRTNNAAGLLEILSSRAREHQLPSRTSPKPARTAAEAMRDVFRPRPVPGTPGQSTTSSATTRESLLDTVSQSAVRDTAASANTRAALTSMIPRRWLPGTTYSPHDLSAVEAAKWQKLRRKPQVDLFDQLALDPVRCYKNVALLSLFVGETGRIKPAKETGLRPVNQRKMARAVRRAIGLGLMPSVHRHPELMIDRRNKDL